MGGRAGSELRRSGSPALPAPARCGARGWRGLSARPPTLLGASPARAPSGACEGSHVGPGRRRQRRRRPGDSSLGPTESCPARLGLALLRPGSSRSAPRLLLLGEAAGRAGRGGRGWQKLASSIGGVGGLDDPKGQSFSRAALGRLPRLGGCDHFPVAALKGRWA